MIRVGRVSPGCHACPGCASSDKPALVPIHRTSVSVPNILANSRRDMGDLVGSAHGSPNRFGGRDTGRSRLVGSSAGLSELPATAREGSTSKPHHIEQLNALTRAESSTQDAADAILQQPLNSTALERSAWAPRTTRSFHDLAIFATELGGGHFNGRPIQAFGVSSGIMRATSTTTPVVGAPYRSRCTARCTARAAITKPLSRSNASDLSGTDGDLRGRTKAAPGECLTSHRCRRDGGRGTR